MENLMRIVPADDQRGLNLLVMDLHGTPEKIQVSILTKMVMEGIGFSFFDKFKVFCIRNIVGRPAFDTVERSLLNNNEARKSLWSFSLEALRNNLFSKSDMTRIYELLTIYGFSPSESLIQNYEMRKKWQK